MIVIYETPEEVAEAAAALVAWQVASNPSGTIGLAGGGTPAAAYRLLAEARLDWSETTLWLGDERWVPPEHEESNTKMIRSTLGAAAERLVSPDYTLGDPHAAAEQYTDVLLPRFEDERPELILLGMGDDGHTASLFPGTEAIRETSTGFVANWVPDKSAWRITATLPLLTSALRLVFLVTGFGKAPMLHRVLEHGDGLPAYRVAREAGNVTWLLDEAAAGQLS